MSNRTGVRCQKPGAWVIAVLLLFLLLPSRSVAAATLRQATEFAAFILAETGITVTEASVAQGEARIAYEQTNGAAPEMLAADWVLLMQAANDFTPDLNRVTIAVWTQGVMQLEVSAEADDLRAMLDGTQDPGAFLAGLSMMDYRPPEVVLKQKLVATMGLDVMDATIAGKEVTISFFQPPVPDATVLMSGWYDILAVAVTSVPDARRITLLAKLSDGSTTTATVPAAVFRAYLAGEIEPKALLSALSVVPGSPPLGAEPGATAQGPRQVSGGDAAGVLPGGSAAEAPVEASTGARTPLLVAGAAVCLTGLVALGVGALAWRRRREAALLPVAARSATPLDPSLCPRCGAGVSPSQRFCPGCGGALPGGLPPPPR